MRNEYTITSNQDGWKLSVLEYVPSKPIGIVQIAHGMSEYKERYEDFMSYLCDKGFICIIHDHRGHGKSIETEDDYGYFNDDNAEYLVEDTHQITNFIKDKYPNLPVCLFGHSMGSLIARKYIKKYDQDIDRLIVCGSPSQNNIVGGAILLPKLVSLFKGKRYRSRFLHNVSVGINDKKFNEGIENAWINSDRKKVEKYNEDKKCGFLFTANGYLNLFKLVRDVYRKRGWKFNNPNLKILFIAGEKDTVIINESAWLNSMTFLREIGYTNIQHHLYPGARHEILNETIHEQVYEDIYNFLTN